MAKKSRPGSGVLTGWEPIEEQAPKAPGQDRPLSKPDRIAPEFDLLTTKYGEGEAQVAKELAQRENIVAPDSDAAAPDRVALTRMKKKGALDNDVGAKTFVVQGKKIIGSQG